MSIARIVAVVLLVAGTLSLVYRGFNYTKESHEGRFGPIELKVKEKDRVEIPVWAGVLMIAAGGGILLVRGRKRG